MHTIRLDNLGIGSFEEIDHIMGVPTEKLSLIDNNISSVDYDFSLVPAKWIGLYGNPVAEEYWANADEEATGAIKVDDTWLLFEEPDDFW